MTSPSLLRYSRGADSRESGPRRPLLHAFLLFLSLPLFLPNLPLQSPSSRRTTNRKRSFKPAVTPTSNLVPIADTRFQNLFPRGVVSGHQSTCLQNSNYIERRERQLQRAHRRLREAMTLEKKKRQRQSHTHHCQQFTRAEFPAGQLPAKFGRRPIKLELYPLVHTYPANYVRVHFRISGYIKRVEWCTEPFGLGLAKV